MTVHGRWENAPHASPWFPVDALVWVTSVFLAAWLRFDFDQVAISAPIMWLGVCLSACHIILGLSFRTYLWRRPPGSVDEILSLGFVCGLTTLLGFGVASVATFWVIPRSVPLIAGLIALVAMLSLRLAVRFWRARQGRSRRGRRVLVFGAGEGGRLVVKSLTQPGSGFAPVALLDDDPRKTRMLLEGVRVVGGRHSVVAAAEQYRADTLAIAVPSAPASLIRDLTERGRKAGLTVLVVPAIQQILSGERSATDLARVDLADLLGRRPIVFNEEVIDRQIRDRVVLVTGAAGSIGSELCYQLARFSPSRLVLLDRDESGMHATILRLTGSGLLDSDDLLLADIRDAETIRRLFSDVRPDIVFHAAALKHLPLLERYPSEAWQTNVLGTLNVLDASARAGVSTFVNVSTDKAANPTSILGLSKRLAEQLTAGYARETAGRFVSVRFGNVIGSRGSVLHAFASQIDQGGPIFVTHPDVERYFMLVAEACQLMLEAACIGRDGQVMVLDMGEPVRIVDLARTLIRLSGSPDIDVVFTGLRGGEKLSEQLYADSEQALSTSNPLVASVDVPPVGPDQISTPPSWVATPLRSANSGASRRSSDVAFQPTASPSVAG